MKGAGVFHEFTKGGASLHLRGRDKGCELCCRGREAPAGHLCCAARVRRPVSQWRESSSAVFAAAPYAATHAVLPNALLHPGPAPSTCGPGGKRAALVAFPGPNLEHVQTEQWLGGGGEALLSRLCSAAPGSCRVQIIETEIHTYTPAGAHSFAAKKPLPQKSHPRPPPPSSSPRPPPMHASPDWPARRPPSSLRTTVTTRRTSPPTPSRSNLPLRSGYGRRSGQLIVFGPPVRLPSLATF